MTAPGEDVVEKQAPIRASVLLVLAHPALERSQANQALTSAALELPTVALDDLYETYPDFLIDVPREQKRLVMHDVIALQFPIYWYATPSLLKEWIDAVWLHGFAYGENGRALEGKTLFVACTAGSPEEDYRPGGAHRYPLDEFLRPLERTAALCRMTWVKPFVLHESRKHDAEALAGEARRFRARLSRFSIKEA